MKKIILFVVTFLSVNSFANEKYPSLLDVTIGTPFSHPKANTNIDKNSPITQFRVLNFGAIEELFPEYEVATLNSSNDVVIITAQKAVKDLALCNSQKYQVTKLLQAKYPKHKLVQNEYKSTGENIFYILQCQQSYGPFYTLHLQFRGQEQDAMLKNAWQKHFNK